jgi:hypothetical protein
MLRDCATVVAVGGCATMVTMGSCATMVAMGGYATVVAVDFRAPGDQHGPPFARSRSAPHAMTVPDIQRPGQAGTLHFTRAAQGDGRVGRLAGRWKEQFWIDALAYPSGTPGSIVLPLTEGPQKPGITSCSGDLVRAWHSRPSHSTHLPRGSGQFSDTVD